MEQFSLVHLINTEFGGPPFTSVTIQLRASVVDHAFVVVDLVKPEPGLSLEDKDLDILWIGLWKRGEKCLRLGGVRFPYDASVAFLFIAV